MKKIYFPCPSLLFKTALLLPVILILGVGGCGKKGPPMALESTMAAPVEDLRAFSREGKLFLAWSIPGRNTDGSRLQDLLGFQVYRQERPLAPAPCADCPLRFTLAAEIDLEYPRQARIEGGRVLWEEKGLASAREYIYFVVAVNSYKTPSPESNRAVVFWDDPPAAPTGVRVQSEEGALRIQWEFTPRLVTGREMIDFAGFHIYRRGEGETFGFSPLNPEPFREAEYHDRSAKEGMRYFYTVRAVRIFRGTPLEGPGSPAVSGMLEKPEPAAPSGLVAVLRSDVRKGAELRWDPGAAGDIAGYEIHRREKGGQEFTRINPRLVAGNYFFDATADPKKSYTYRVRAVNHSGKTSAFSPPAEVSPEP